MAADLFEGHYVWHPAADDRVLASVCVDVRAGRYRSADEALAETRTDFGLRAHRSLVLASEAAGSDLVERWLAEEPTPEAALMWARVAVQRALRAADARDERAEALERIALAACDRAAEAAPADPTPWVARLSMARLHRLRDPAPKGLLTSPPGPWRLFAHILSLDPWHREAHHRFLSCFFTRHGGSVTAAWDVAAFLSQRAPADSPCGCCPWWPWWRATTPPSCSPTGSGNSPSGAPPRWRSTRTGCPQWPVTASPRCSTSPTSRTRW